MANASDLPRVVMKRCSVCGRFRAYVSDDRFCVECGHDALEDACACGRPFDYLRGSEDDTAVHCPRCGAPIRGRAREYDG